MAKKRLNHEQRMERQALEAEIGLLEQRLERIEAQRLAETRYNPELRRQADAIYYKIASRRAWLSGQANEYGGIETAIIGHLNSR